MGLVFALGLFRLSSAGSEQLQRLFAIANREFRTRVAEFSNRHKSDVQQGIRGFHRQSFGTD